MKNLLDKITNKTIQLWYEVNRKYGEHEYTLGVNGIGQIELSYHYMKKLVIGNNRQIQAKLKNLLK